MAVETLLPQAIAAHQAGRMDEAERLYRAVLQERPDHADACALLGIVVGARQAYDEAIACVDKAVELDPSSGLLRFHQGTVLMAAGKLDLAIPAMHRALMLNPETPQIHFNLANGLRAAGKWTQAIEHYREALRLDPASAPTYNNLALALVYTKDFDEALVLARQAIALDPTYGDGWLTLSNVAEKLKDYDLALEAGARAVALTPDNSYAWFGYGLALNRNNRNENAVAAYRRALEINPDSVDTMDNLAQTYQALNQLEQAEQMFRQTVAAAGQTIADEDDREVEESEYGKRHWHLALIELLRGKYKQGFTRYRARGAAIPELKRMSLPCPLWKGEALRGRKILICDEQGFGDTLMMARFLPMIKAQGAEIVFSVHRALAPLFLNWDVVDRVIAHEDVIPPCDYFCSSFDLPHRLGITLDNLPHKVPYLPVFQPDTVTLLPTGGFKIGVVWGGSPLHLSDRKRSVPLKLFATLFLVPNVQFYCFNRDLKPGDADILSACSIVNLIPHLTDFAAAARLIGQMDLIITCDTATAHLAGGLGKKTWVMLPFAPDWRWMTGRDDSPWYPTLRLFRQPKSGDWDSVVNAVKTQLESSL